VYRAEKGISIVEQAKEMKKRRRAREPLWLQRRIDFTIRFYYPSKSPPTLPW
jgi:hypothetical protein